MVPGQCLFLADLHSVSADKFSGTRGNSQAAVEVRTQLFYRLPLKRQRNYTGQAEVHAETQSQEHIQESSLLMSQRAIATQRLAQEQLVI